MPARTDLETILVIGSGPIVIGQACEFDYSGAQACKVLRAEGYRVVLVNSNPATIMTDPELADATYIEPITSEYVEAVIARERPDACLPTMGGQTGLNVAMELASAGVLEAYGVELIGATQESIGRAEDRRRFRDTMAAAGLDIPRSSFAHSVEEALEVGDELGYPLVVRGSYVLGGGGSGVVHDANGLRRAADNGIRLSGIGEVLIEEYLVGWKEFELELMRDVNDNVVVVCSIENVDPMGVHTGDSITVAPAMTLTDLEYQSMRDDGARVMRAIGVATGGSNVQFAVDPVSGRRVVIEMNPRVSRSSALASKATGFPIAKIAAKLAVGFTLDEIPNDITRKTPASFEPSIDYVVVKIPRWSFEKFPGAPPELTTQMKSLGEVMAIGRTFPEALQKGWRSLEKQAPEVIDDDMPVADGLVQPTEERLTRVEHALAHGMSVAEVARLTSIDAWFIGQLADMAEVKDIITGLGSVDALDAPMMRTAKRFGYSDSQIGGMLGAGESEVRARRLGLEVLPTFKTVDTCAAEFEAQTPYHYSTYEDEDEVRDGVRPRVLILGSGPNRIGQGIEFDYCCVHAAFALRDAGYETVMVNCNPETVSTDYDTSDRLYFEPLTFEDVMNVVARERPVGVIVQLGGQSPLKLAGHLTEAGVPILGTSFEAIDRAEDRQRFGELLAGLRLASPPGGMARSVPQANAVARSIGYPVLVRPSYVLGGRAMAIVYDEESLDRYMSEAAEVTPNQPVLVDKFLEGAIEIDCDAVFDSDELYVGGVLEHIEEAGIHSGDSACVIPPMTLGDDQVAEIMAATEAIARALGIKGLINVQFALKGDSVYVIEANPRASRTVPFISKATGVPLAKVAARVMTGSTLRELRAEGLLPGAGAGHDGLRHVAVKEAVLPFERFPGQDVVLGPEMRSTGEVMGIDRDFGLAFAKAEAAAGVHLPLKGNVFISVANTDKRAVIWPTKRLQELGFTLMATRGTAGVLERAGVDVTRVAKVSEPTIAGEPNIVERIHSGDIDMIFNTPWGRGARNDGYEIRTAAVRAGVPCITTMAGMAAGVQAIEALTRGEHGVNSLQSYLKSST
ncbi:MAG: carbamoyl-phosphate synthase large subunit [Actinobacteria bacterium]|nr:carbamoyl-phosphate synthase large subunit [Actinomycetota bacterium]MDQ3531290.1 carbamoyl-phosphate synthase large subunit [Actinomycetota bacterium]